MINAITVVAFLHIALDNQNYQRQTWPVSSAFIWKIIRGTDKTVRHVSGNCVFKLSYSLPCVGQLCVECGSNELWIKIIILEKLIHILDISWLLISGSILFCGLSSCPFNEKDTDLLNKAMRNVYLDDPPPKNVFIMQFSWNYRFILLLKWENSSVENLFSSDSSSISSNINLYSADVCIEFRWAGWVKTTIWISSATVIHHEQAVIYLNHIPLFLNHNPLVLDHLQPLVRVLLSAKI